MLHYYLTNSGKGKPLICQTTLPELLSLLESAEKQNAMLTKPKPSPETNATTSPQLKLPLHDNSSMPYYLRLWRRRCCSRKST
jgi:hypothetical protein